MSGNSAHYFTTLLFFNCVLCVFRASAFINQKAGYRPRFAEAENFKQLRLEASRLAVRKERSVDSGEPVRLSLSQSVSKHLSRDPVPHGVPMAITREEI